MQTDLKGVIFDLDGVLTDTARWHYRAWKRLADQIGIPFDEKINERMKGVDRMASLEILLEASAETFDAAAKERLAATKNGYYLSVVERLTPKDLFPGAAAALDAVKAHDLGLALASASKNAATLLDRLGIAGRFDYIADANLIRRHKPDPEIFLTAAAGLGLPPEVCVGVEDAAAGIAAIRAAGMRAVGVGEAAPLAAADLVIGHITEFRIDACRRLFQ